MAQSHVAGYPDYGDHGHTRIRREFFQPTAAGQPLTMNVLKDL